MRREKQVRKRVLFNHFLLVEYLRDIKYSNILNGKIIDKFLENKNKVNEK